MSEVKFDASAIIQGIQLLSGLVMRWREANNKPLDDTITAEDIMRIQIHETDAAIAEGERGG